MRYLTLIAALSVATTACSDGETFELHLIREVTSTSRLCGPSIQYCLDSSPASGQLPPARLKMKGTPHLVVRAGCEGDGERVGDSVFVSFARAGTGTCYWFSIRARIAGDRITGRWKEGTDGHGAGTSGSLEGFRD